MSIVAHLHLGAFIRIDTLHIHFDVRRFDLLRHFLELCFLLVVGDLLIDIALFFEDLDLVLGEEDVGSKLAVLEGLRQQFRFNFYLGGCLALVLSLQLQSAEQDLVHFA